MAIKGLKRTEAKTQIIHKYEYKGCLISKSLYPKRWYVHAAYDYVNVSRGLTAKTLKALCTKIDKDLRKK